MHNTLQFIVIALISGFASVLAQKGLAVFNDALRPVMPESIEGRMPRKTLFATSFALSFGLVIGFGIPISIGAPILLVIAFFWEQILSERRAQKEIKGRLLPFLLGSSMG